MVRPQHQHRASPATRGRELARNARRLATYEGFDGHANAVSELRDEILKGSSSKR